MERRLQATPLLAEHLSLRCNLGRTSLVQRIVCSEKLKTQSRSPNSLNIPYFSSLTFLPNIPSSPLSDEQLILQYKKTGDMSLLGSLYHRYMDLVYGVCLKYYKEPERSKDSVMLIFEELVTKLKKHEVENFRGWLHQLAKNHCLMQLRTPKNMKTVEFNGELVQTEESLHLNAILEKEENFVKMENCLETLVGDQQQSIRLFYLEGKCYNEIVETTGLEWSQVRSAIQNGRRNLKICMERDDGIAHLKPDKKEKSER